MFSLLYQSDGRPHKNTLLCVIIYSMIVSYIYVDRNSRAIPNGWSHIVTKNIFHINEIIDARTYPQNATLTIVI